MRSYYLPVTEQEDDVILHLRLGVPEAVKVLFFQFYPEFFSFSAMLLQDGPAAREVTIESMLLLWNRHAGFGSEKAIKTFLYVAIRNRCLARLKGEAGGADVEALLAAVSPELPQEMVRDILRYTG